MTRGYQHHFNCAFSNIKMVGKYLEFWGVEFVEGRGVPSAGNKAIESVLSKAAIFLGELLSGAQL